MKAANRISIPARHYHAALSNWDDLQGYTETSGGTVHLAVHELFQAVGLEFRQVLRAARPD